MGKFLNQFKKGTDKTKETLKKTSEKMQTYSRDDFKKTRFNNPSNKEESLYNPENDDFYDDFYDNPNNNFYDPFYDEQRVTPAQKPESFHHFILENQYKDLEKSIRGVKDVWDKEQQKWVTKRKENHCFTDEEAEEILRTAQSHLSTDIKLGYVPLDSFGELMDALYDEIEHLFRAIAEYRYGRYGDYDNQYKMKLQNKKIFLELWTRIQANYSRSIKGRENNLTHDSVKGQESLQQTDRDFSLNKGYM